MYVTFVILVFAPPLVINHALSPKRATKNPYYIRHPPRIRDLEKNAKGFFVALFGERA
jgi:hypothetical protein